ncbi:hypothetical protein PCL1606_17080 [Pseudomonas chlororaphis]|uniref:Uncharacterized protein n=1 Tax=Pseudomonas chlororaphis TaxID=587753 RepID=A0A0D5XVS8_9PSED|nr:hypothetical protein PCL1606_17080 [Pseudomonas chlororaphis]
MLQHMTATHQEYGHEPPRLATYDFGMEAAPIAPFLNCPEVVMPGVRRL